jgi:hypothetical protein
MHGPLLGADKASMVRATISGSKGSPSSIAIVLIHVQKRGPSTWNMRLVKASVTVSNTLSGIAYHPASPPIHPSGSYRSESPG